MNRYNGHLANWLVDHENQFERNTVRLQNLIRKLERLQKTAQQQQGK